MLKCIRIRTCTKKKLKYNLKLLKFRKASQVLRSCQENAIIRGLWVTSQEGVGRRLRSSDRSFPQSEGPRHHCPHPRRSREEPKVLGERVLADSPRGQRAFTPKTSVSRHRRQRTASWERLLPRAGPQPPPLVLRHQEFVSPPTAPDYGEMGAGLRG